MVGTKQGGIKLRETMIKKYGSYEAWRKALAEGGRRGGRNGTTGGFASDVRGADGLTGIERARIAGKKGGTISRRGRRDEAKL